MTEATKSVVIERDFAHPPQKIWRALTQSALIEDWLLKTDFTPDVGKKFTFRSQPMPQWDGIIDGKVLTVTPHEKLVYSWKSMGVVTLVTWTLTPSDAGTHLRMEQSGFRPDQAQNYAGATYGWNAFIGKLATVLDGMD